MSSIAGPNDSCSLSKKRMAVNLIIGGFRFSLETHLGDFGVLAKRQEDFEDVHTSENLCNYFVYLQRLPSKVARREGVSYSTG